MTGESQKFQTLEHYLQKWQLFWKHLNNYASTIKAILRITIPAFLLKGNRGKVPISSKINRPVKTEHNSLYPS